MARSLLRCMAAAFAAAPVLLFAQTDPVAAGDPPGAAAAPTTPLYQPRSVPAGAWSVTPRLGISAGVTDNITLSPPAESSFFGLAPIRSAFVTWTPEIVASLPSGSVDHYDLSLRGEFTRYASSHVNDTDNLEIGFDGLKLLDPQTAVAWRVTAQDWNDAVGTTDLSLGASSPDHYRAAAAGAVLRHDSEDGAWRTEGEATVSRKRYRNHRDITRLGDVDTRSLVGRVLTIVSPGPQRVTRVLAEARLSMAKFPAYPEFLERLDSSDARLLTGVYWEAAENANPAWTGSAKLGVQRKAFDGARPGYTGATWDVVLHWQPRPGTSFDLGAGRALADAPGDDSNGVVVRQETLVWTEAWRPDLRSSLTLVGGANRYRGGIGPIARRDRLEALELAFRYDLRRNLQIGLNCSVSRRGSSDPAFDYARRMNSVVLQMAL